MRKVFSGLRSILIFLLVVSMLTMAALYIGAARTQNGAAAYTREKLPAGVRSRGAPDGAATENAATDFLGVAFAAVGCDGKGGYAYADEDAAKKLIAFAAPLLSEILSESSTAALQDPDVFFAAQGGDFVLLRLHTPLPMAALGVLCGQSAAATAVRGLLADTLLLSFDKNGGAALSVTDGRTCCTFDGAAPEKRTVLAALAGAESLHPYTLVSPTLFLPTEAPTLSPVLLTATDFAATLSEESVYSLFSTFGFNPEKLAPRRTADGVSTVEPQGQMEIASDRITYLAAEGSALPLDEFCTPGENELSSLVAASAGLFERIQNAAKTRLYGDAELYLAALGETDGVYTLHFGLTVDGVPVLCDGNAIFAALTADENGITLVSVFPAALTRAHLRATRFAADWQYAHAAQKGGITDFALLYDLPAASGEAETGPVEAEWYAAFAEGGDGK